MWISLYQLDKDNENKIHQKWYRVVSPESYGMTEDAESRHILWCPNARCRNYTATPGSIGFGGGRRVK